MYHHNNWHWLKSRLDVVNDTPYVTVCFQWANIKQKKPEAMNKRWRLPRHERMKEWREKYLTDGCPQFWTCINWQPRLTCDEWLIKWLKSHALWSRPIKLRRSGGSGESQEQRGLVCGHIVALTWCLLRIFPFSSQWQWHKLTCLAASDYLFSCIFEASTVSARWMQQASLVEGEKLLPCTEMQSQYMKRMRRVKNKELRSVISQTG